MFTLIPSGLLVSLNNGDIERAHCWSLLLEGWIFSSGWNYNSLSKRETMILGLCIACNHTKVVSYSVHGATASPQRWPKRKTS